MQIGELLAAIFSSGMVYGLVGAAAAVILTGIGSATGIGYTASASAGVMTEDPRGFGKYLILVALPGTQGIYGFVAAFMAVAKLQLLSLESSIRHKRRYIRTCDPTYREYTREYARQVMSFEQSFYEALGKMWD